MLYASFALFSFTNRPFNAFAIVDCHIIANTLVVVQMFAAVGGITLLGLLSNEWSAGAWCFLLLSQFKRLQSTSRVDFSRIEERPADWLTGWLPLSWHCHCHLPLAACRLPFGILIFVNPSSQVRRTALPRQLLGGIRRNLPAMDILVFSTFRGEASEKCWMNIKFAVCSCTKLIDSGQLGGAC